MPSINTISPKKLCQCLLFVVLFVIVSVAWFLLVTPELISNGSEASLFTAFAGTALWIVCGYWIVIYVVRKAPPAQR